MFSGQFLTNGNLLILLSMLLPISDKIELNGRYIKTSKENFINTLNISCYSFTKIAYLSSSLMSNGGSLITLTFYGANKVMPSYNVMGISQSSIRNKC